MVWLVKRRAVGKSMHWAVGYTALWQNPIELGTAKDAIALVIQTWSVICNVEAKERADTSVGGDIFLLPSTAASLLQVF